jgi:hypothetical protein
MIFGITWAQWGLILTVVSVTLLWLHVFPATRAVMIFVGICLMGGKLAAILTAVARGVSHVTDGLLGKLFGASVGGILVVVFGIILVTHLHPKGKGAGRSTFWISAFLACLLIAGVSTFAAVNGIPADIKTGVTSVGG